LPEFPPAAAKPPVCGTARAAYQTTGAFQVARVAA